MTRVSGERRILMNNIEKEKAEKAAGRAYRLVYEIVYQAELAFSSIIWICSLIAGAYKGIWYMIPKAVVSTREAFGSMLITFSSGLIATGRSAMQGASLLLEALPD